jgi:Na+-translocating ferredoxin:NAD+ oxidoreductase RnfG subunit
MKKNIKQIITLTLIALICSSLIYLTYQLIGGLS